MEEIFLPPRVFAAGDEPVGDRVNSYHKWKITRQIIAALEPEEFDFIRNSTFGRILAIDDHPPFSGAFGQHIVVRLLKVNKKYEFWFLFAGNPIRMSLREFAIVTGLNCAKIPRKKKTKNPLKEKLYWNELFGSLKFVTVATAIDMLQNKVVKTRELRIKMACLAITSSILFPSSHTPRIIGEHVELIRDLQEFLAYPWGRASYQTLAASLKGKDEIALAQTSVAIRGYVEAIQQIMLSAIPQLKEEVTQAQRVVIVDEESDGETQRVEETLTEDENVGAQGKPPLDTKYCVIPGHAKTIDFECQVPVKSILDDPYEGWSVDKDFQWIDETEDLAVDNMVRLIQEGFVFSKEMFKGGLNALDLSRLRGEKKLKEKELKDKNDKDHVAEGSECDGSADYHDMILSLEKRIYQDLDAKLEKLVPPTSQSQQVALLQSTISRCFQDLDKKIADSIGRQLKDMQGAIIKGVIDVLAGRPTIARPATVTEPTGPSLYDFATPSEAADFRINDVLRDLNIVSDDSLTASKVTRPASIDQEGPNNDDSAPLDESDQEEEEQQLEKQQMDSNGDDSSPMEETEQPLEKQHDDTNLIREQAPRSPANPTALLNQQPISDDTHPLVKHIEGNVIETALSAHPNNQAAGVETTVNQDAVSEEVDMSKEDAPVSKEHAAEAVEQRKSKRAKVAPVVLQDYKCDPKVTGGLSIIPDLDKRFELMEQRLQNESIVILPNGYALSPAEFFDIAHRKTVLPARVVDSLIGVVACGPASSPKVGIYDTTLPVTLMNHHSRFVKTALKDRVKLKFDNVTLETPIPKAPERIYFPFNIDRKHWVGVCLDVRANTLHVLDCNTSLLSDSLLKKELTPIANLIPYVLKHLRYTEGNAVLKPFTVSRCRGIPQISEHTEAAVMTLLFIEAHAGDGLGGCKGITPRLLPDAAKQLAVKLFDDLSV